MRLQKRMHASLYALLFLTVLLGISVLLEGCTDKCETTTYYTYFEPIYKTTAEVQSEIKLEEPQPVRSIGKIYRRGSLMFLGDPGRGVHIIDNTDPSNPIKKSFLTIPGNYDLAVSGNFLYADNYTDLVVFDLSNIEAVREVGRVEHAFDNGYMVEGFVGDQSRGIVTGWKESEDMTVSVSDCATPGIVCFDDGVAVANTREFYASFNKSTATAPGNGSGPGVGGSLARFTISKNYLYSLAGGSIKPFDLSTPASPQAVEGKYVNWDIETIFPYNDNLFLGSSTGMYIYDISKPESPEIVSLYSHVRSCDPVVVEGNYAYVTLRSGNECAGFTNQLEVIDISNLHQPELLKVYPMTNPHGLGIDNGTLFVCDRGDGLKVYDASDIDKITENKLAHYNNIDAYDVIPWNNLLIMIGADGLFQYDYSDPTQIKLLSHIPVTNAQ